MYCKKCGTQVDDKAAFCSACGSKMINKESQQNCVSANKASGLDIAERVLIVSSFFLIFMGIVFFIASVAGSGLNENFNLSWYPSFSMNRLLYADDQMLLAAIISTGLAMAPSGSSIIISSIKISKKQKARLELSLLSLFIAIMVLSFTCYGL